MTLTSLATGTRPIAVTTPRHVLVHAAMVASTVVLPMLAHTLGWRVLVVLPMFWGVVLAGSVYGWQAGLLAGIAAPLLNTVMTGMPPAALLPAMMVELAIYGSVPALVSRLVRYRVPAAVGVAIAIIAGRGAMVGVWALTAGSFDGAAAYVAARVVPGLPAQALQVAMIPPLAELLKLALSDDQRTADGATSK